MTRRPLSDRRLLAGIVGFTATPITVGTGWDSGGGNPLDDLRPLFEGLVVPVQLLTPVPQPGPPPLVIRSAEEYREAFGREPEPAWALEWALK